TPADDPDLARLEALALEHRNDLHTAHECWQTFEKSVAAHPAAWPAGQADRARALIWSHMGENATHAADLDESDLPPFMRGRARPPTLKPSAAQCFRRSLQLPPARPQTH